jgi:SAM-dependent methyltransferase
MRREEVFRIILAPLSPGRLVDLGAGHGGFARIAHERGWAVTAVDARTERMPMTPGIEWIHADVRDFPLDGFECICMLGLLYHLELADQLGLLRRAAGTLTIIDTHVALEATHEEGGYPGRTFQEDLEAPTASWGNPTSFWPTEDSLVRILHDCGFTAAFKLVPPYREDRTFWVCR